MIDIETMSTSQHATICSIGACKFDPNTPNKIGDEFYAVIDWNLDDRDVDMGTIRWWMEQSDVARAQISRTDGIPLAQALNNLANFLGPNDIVWGNGATFDISILQDAYEGVTPWAFWNVGDVRTVVDLAHNVFNNSQSLRTVTSKGGGNRLLTGNFATR